LPERKLGIKRTYFLRGSNHNLNIEMGSKSGEKYQFRSHDEHSDIPKYTFPNFDGIIDMGEGAGGA
jgi:hypothetical protein